MHFWAAWRFTLQAGHHKLPLMRAGTQPWLGQCRSRRDTAALSCRSSSGPAPKTLGGRCAILKRRHSGGESRLEAELQQVLLVELRRTAQAAGHA